MLTYLLRTTVGVVNLRGVYAHKLKGFEGTERGRLSSAACVVGQVCRVSAESSKCEQ